MEEKEVYTGRHRIPALRSGAGSNAKRGVIGLAITALAATAFIVPSGVPESKQSLVKATPSALTSVKHVNYIPNDSFLLERKTGEVSRSYHRKKLLDVKHKSLVIAEAKYQKRMASERLLLAEKKVRDQRLLEFAQDAQRESIRQQIQTDLQNRRALERATAARLERQKAGRLRAERARRLTLQRELLRRDSFVASAPRSSFRAPVKTFSSPIPLSNRKARLVQLGHILQSRGFTISEHPAFGGVCASCHSPTGLHYQSGAIDVNYDGHVQSEYSKVTSVLSLVRNFGLNVMWQVPNHYDHLHIDVGTTLRASTPAYAPVSGVAACIRKWESGGNYRAQNPNSTASGAYQFLDSTWQAVTGLSGRAMNYSVATQDRAFTKLWANGAGARQWVTAFHCI